MGPNLTAAGPLSESARASPGGQASRGGGCARSPSPAAKSIRRPGESIQAARVHIATINTYLCIYIYIYIHICTYVYKHGRNILFIVVHASDMDFLYHCDAQTRTKRLWCLATSGQTAPMVPQAENPSS